jgi:hypothetical protein
MFCIVLEKLQDGGPLDGYENALLFELGLFLFYGHFAHVASLT